LVLSDINTEHRAVLIIILVSLPRVKSSSKCIETRIALCRLQIFPFFSQICDANPI
jgi:hypothetical protein